MYACNHFHAAETLSGYYYRLLSCLLLSVKVRERERFIIKKKILHQLVPRSQLGRKERERKEHAEQQDPARKKKKKKKRRRKNRNLRV